MGYVKFCNVKIKSFDNHTTKNAMVQFVLLRMEKVRSVEVTVQRLAGHEKTDGVD